MAEIAVNRTLASGAGWTVEDLVCTRGPRDRPFEEQHGQVTVGLVVAGTFQYRGALVAGDARRCLMTPGSVLLGSPGQCFECGHEHGAGDRCVSFHYSPACFERIADRAPSFQRLRIPPLRDLSLLFASVHPARRRDPGLWEEAAVRVAGAVARVEGAEEAAVPPSAMRRVDESVRFIEERRSGALSLDELAREARLSPYHFLRMFEQATGVTPHQYVRRLRLVDAGRRLLDGADRIAAIAFDSGFGDVSNFNRVFRAEFGVSPQEFRLTSGFRPACRSGLPGAGPGCGCR